MMGMCVFECVSSCLCVCVYVYRVHAPRMYIWRPELNIRFLSQLLLPSPSVVSVPGTKTTTESRVWPNITGESRVWSNITGESWRQELKERGWSNVAYWLSFHGLLSSVPRNN